MQLIKEFIGFGFRVLSWLIIIRAILSWIPSMRQNRMYHMLMEMTEVFIAPVRRILPQSGGMIDIAPLVTFFLLRVLESVIMGIL